jgi:preprotein translocase SecE subunit
MAISRSKNNSIADAQLSNKQVETKKSDLGLKKPELKKGLIKSTLFELSKVEWPSFKYTLRWSEIIIIFTIFISLFIGYADQVFTSGISFVDCTKPLVGKDAEKNVLSGCSTDFINSVTFR